MEKRVKSIIYLYFYWLILSTLISFFFIFEFSLAFSNFVSLIRYIQIISITIVLMFYRINTKDIIFIFKIMYINAIFIAFYGIYQTRNFNNMVFADRDWWGRTFSVFESSGPNAFSAYMVFFLVAAFCLIIETKINLKFRLLNLFIFIIMLYPFLFATSRTGYLALIISMGFIILIKKPYSIPIFILVIAILISSNSFIYEKLIAYTFSGSGLDSSSLGRLEYWKGAISTILHYPISGVGFNGFSVIGLNYLSSFDVLIDVHNEYLQTLLNSGIVGFVIFYLLLFSLFNTIIIKRKNQKILFIKNVYLIYLASLIALLFSSLFSTPFLNFQLIGQFWVTTALILKFKEEKNESFNVHNI
jgi:O-antigen ligase